MNIFSNKLYKVAILVSGVGLIVYLFVFNTPTDVTDNVYEKRKFDHSEFSNIKFSEKSSQLGINYIHHMYSEKTDLSVEPVSTSTSVIDINRDGWMDIFITTSAHHSNLLYINHEGKYFTEEASKFGLGDNNGDYDPSYAFWGDFNGDGRLDLLLGKYGCHKFYLGDKNNHFTDKSEWLRGYCSKPNGINAADFYNHGKLDIIFANFLPFKKIDLAKALWMANTRYDNVSGGENHLLKNFGDHFEVEKNAIFLTHSYSHNAGIADVNLDGLYDIFFSNDYAHDEMFLNRGNGVFEDITNKYIPKEFHGLSGMNTEFFDYDNDGLIDLYVTNIFKPPFNRHFNLLWKKNTDGTFTNVSHEVGNAKCGFSWGAKFADVDNDGEADLFVVNGRSRSGEVKTKAEGKSMWYERHEVSQIPWFLKKYYRPVETLKGRYISAFERKCLFVQKEGKFYDIALDAGFDDREENRGLALIDYDNDGRMDAITSGPMAKLKIYHNETKISGVNHWIGFQMIDKKGSTIAHGAILTTTLRDKKIIRQEFPANGYKGFNDPRIHLGLGETNKIEYVDVFWPLSKVKKRYRKFKLDQYNDLEESASNEVVK